MVGWFGGSSSSHCRLGSIPEIHLGLTELELFLASMSYHRIKEVATILSILGRCLRDRTQPVGLTELELFLDSMVEFEARI